MFIIAIVMQELNSPQRSSWFLSPFTTVQVVLLKLDLYDKNNLQIH